MQLKLKKTLSNDNHGCYSAGRSRVNQISLGVSENDSILVDEINNSIEPAFETQNYLYELQSKYNNLEYEKTKINIAHQNVINDLKHRNQQLDKLTANLTAQNTHLTTEKDRLRNALEDRRKENYQLNRQNNTLKMELQNIQKNHLHHENALLHRDREIQIEEQLAETKQLLEMKNEEISRLKTRITKLTQSSSSMKEQSMAMLKQRTKELQRQKTELTQKLEQAHIQLDSTKSINTESRNTVKENEELRQEIQQLQHDKATLLIQLQDLHNKERRSSMTLGNDSLRRLKQTLALKQLKLKEVENDREQSEKKTNELTLELNRLTSQNNSLQQQNRHLQDRNSQHELHLKTTQNELCENEREIAELKSQMLTLRVQNKKMISSIRLEFEQERLKNTLSIERVQKNLHPLKQFQFSWRKESGEHLYNNTTQDLQRKNQQIEALNIKLQLLKDENESLRNETRNMQAKYESRYAKLDRQIRSEYQKLRPLHPDADRFQFESVQIPPKSLQDLSAFKCSQLLTSIKDENNQDLIELLKIEKKEQTEQIRQLLQHQQQQNQTIALIEQEMQEMRTSKAHHASVNNREKHEKQRAINELTQEISKVNEELKRERINNEQLRQEIYSNQQKWSTETESLFEQSETIKSTNSNLTLKIHQLQTEMHDKETTLAEKQDEIAKLSTEIENNKICENYFESKIQELQLMLEKIKQGKDTENNQTHLLSSALAVTDGKAKTLHSSQDSPPTLNPQEEGKQSSQELISRISQLEGENYSIKCDYSESLQEINVILLRYRNLEEKYKLLLQESNSLKHQQSGETFRGLRENKSAKEFIKNCEIHISTSNQILMKNTGGRHHQSSKHLHNTTHHEPSFFDRREPNPSFHHHRPQKPFKRTHQPAPYYPQHDHIKQDTRTNPYLRPYHQ